MSVPNPPQPPDTIDFDTPPPPEKKGGRGWIIALAAAVAVILLGGGAYAVIASGVLGGGTQPHDVLPKDAIGYLRLDLNPDAGQKAALMKISDRFTFSKGAYSEENPGASLFTALQREIEDLREVDYAKEIGPWLGDRLGIALVPGATAGEPDFALAVQVTDEEAARTGIAKLQRGEGHGLAFRDGYAILTPTKDKATEYAAGPSLAENAKYTADLKALDGDGVLSFWADLGGIAATTTGQKESAGQLKNASMIGTLRFDSAFAELTGLLRGADVKTGDAPVKTDLARLPATTAAAVSVSGLDQLVTEHWTRYEQSRAANSEAGRLLDRIEQAAGLTLPDDLATLLGKNLTLAADAEGLDGDQPKVGLRLTTDPAKAKDLIDRIQAMFTQSDVPLPELAEVQGDGVLTIASSDEYAKQLDSAGTLGESETFKTAVPNSAESTQAIFVDLDKLERFYLDKLKGDERANIEALRAIGLSSAQRGDTTGVTLRVLFN